ncbi:flagellar motor protein MotB [Oceaniglobus trochenteri]|uniref:flagellar motor protein MotB n=1 Tax=Oceaniglobus trochenteri TaxID=2763260 RepID=UPI001CFF7D72|nr:flagellar motor protein MotB [Oceaniglobus trochenteri]
MTAHANAPVIIKRKKIIAGGHHGGAWKVAYADFVTAMMAFFMLMWLLNATTETQRKGIADYFNPTIPINRISGGGGGSFGGENVFSEEELAKNGSGASARYHADDDKARGPSGVDTERAGDGEGDMSRELAELADRLSGRSGESMVSEELARHIVTRVTDQGLIVELFDLPDAMLFEGDSDRARPLLRELVDVVSQVFALAENRIAIGAHVRAQPIVRLDNPVWDNSGARAHRVLGMLQGSDLDNQRIQRVTGYADRKPAVANPMAVRNNRIEMILLRRD